MKKTNVKVNHFCGVINNTSSRGLVSVNENEQESKSFFRDNICAVAGVKKLGRGHMYCQKSPLFLPFTNAPNAIQCYCLHKVLKI